MNKENHTPDKQPIIDLRRIMQVQVIHKSVMNQLPCTSLAEIGESNIIATSVNAGGKLKKMTMFAFMEKNR